MIAVCAELQGNPISDPRWYVYILHTPEAVLNRFSGAIVCSNIVAETMRAMSP
jgi:hypothetical protein